MRVVPYACPSAEQLADALVAAFLEQLAARTPPPVVSTRVRLDDTDRPPVVPLWPNGGDRA